MIAAPGPRNQGNFPHFPRSARMLPGLPRGTELAHTLDAGQAVPCAAMFASHAESMTRTRVFWLRLLVTLAIVGLMAAILRIYWYPGAYFSMAGAARFVWILAAVAVVIGPGLTALVYRPGKPGLGVDIAVLAGLELLAIAWALAVLYERRPYFVVFAVDRFEVVTAQEIDRTDLALEEFHTRPRHAPRLVYAALPDDVETRNALIDDVLFGGGPDIDRRPEFWQDYAAGTAVVRERARPVSELLVANDRRARRVRTWLDSQVGETGDYAYVPVRGRVADATVIVHTTIAYPVDVLAVDPW